jgi:hypothetical protein
VPRKLAITSDACQSVYQRKHFLQSSKPFPTECRGAADKHGFWSSADLMLSKRRLLQVAAMLGLAVLVFAFTQAKQYFDRQSELKQPLDFRRFYQIALDITHDKAERLNLKYIVACGTTSKQQYRNNNGGGYIRVPSVFGWATKGGQGIMIHSPDVCGYDLKKILPDDFLPLMYHAEKAGDMSFFTAYMTEDAYEQKASRMIFHKADVTEVTRADYESWLKSSPPNIVPQIDGPRGFEIFNDDYFRKSDSRYQEDLRADARRLGPIHCQYMQRFPLPDEAKKLVRNLRTSKGITQRLWALGYDSSARDETGDLPQLKSILLSNSGPQKDGQNRTGPYDEKTSGIMRRNGSGRLRHLDGGGFLPGKPFKGFWAPYYRTDLYPDAIPKEPIQTIEHRVETRDGLDQGFAYCTRIFAPPLDKFGNYREFEFAPDAKLNVYWDGDLIAQFPARGLRDRYRAGFIIEGENYFYGSWFDSFEVEYARMR